VTESLAEFKDSFFYGSRSDLNVKFLADLSPDEAGDFFAEMLASIGRVLDDGDVEPLIGRFIEWQRRAYAGHLDRKAKFAYDDTPFTLLTRPLAESRVALISSSGHFVDGDDPQPFGEPAMTQAEAEARISEFLRAEPTLSTIPVDTAPEQLRARHGGYPIAAVHADHQVALPLEHLRAAQARGLFRELAPDAYSFVGAASQLRLRDKVAPTWTEMLRAAEVDLVLLVPV
jgi:D-proline reductase (dithiol) PrdB